MPSRRAFAMFWEILWALALGFSLSAVAQAVVSKKQMTRLLPDDSPKTLAIARGLGAAPSSCYTTVLNVVFLGLAAVLLWRFFRTGAMQMLRTMNKMPEEGGNRRAA